MTHFVVRLLGRPGQPLHERLLLIQPAHIILRNTIIKSEFCFLQKTADSRGAAETPGELHTYCNVLNTKEVEEEEEEDVDLVSFCTSFPWRSSAL